MRCYNNPTCDITCKSICHEALRWAQTHHTSYERGVEMIVKIGAAGEGVDHA